MSDDDYDLLPHSELKKIETEINSLKNASGTSTLGLQRSMEDLSQSLKSMISIFTEAKNELRIEDEEKELVSKKIEPMIKNISELLDQNEKIAEGILSLADMIKKVEAKIDRLENKISTINAQSFEQMTETTPENIFQRQQPLLQPRMQMPQQTFPKQMPQQMQQFSQQPINIQEEDIFADPFAQQSSPIQQNESTAFNNPTAGIKQNTPPINQGEIFKQEPFNMPPPPPPRPPTKKGFFSK